MRKDFTRGKIAIPDKEADVTIHYAGEQYLIHHATFPLNANSHENGAIVEFKEKDCPREIWLKYQGRALVKWSDISPVNFKLPRRVHSKMVDIFWNVPRERWEAINTNGQHGARFGALSIGYYRTEKAASSALRSFLSNPKTWDRKDWQDEHTIITRETVTNYKKEELN